MLDTEKTIYRIVEAYKAAVFAKDVDAFIALYDAEVCVFEMWGQWSHEGVDVWRAVIAGWLGSLGTERVRVEMEEVRIMTGEDLAIAHAFVRYTGVSSEGHDLRAMHNRLTWGLKQQDGAWKIVHEHLSRFPK